MTVQEAIKLFKGITIKLPISENIKANDAVVLAIKALEAQRRDRWIPVSEGLPNENEEVEVTIKEIANGIGGYRYYTKRAWLLEGKFNIKKNPYNPEVIAWKPLMEPWREESL